MLAEQISSVCKAHRESARNLVHCVVLRRRDIRNLQERLTSIGLSSLGRAEADVLGAIDAVLWALHRIARQPDPVPITTNSSEDAPIRELPQKAQAIVLRRGGTLVILRSSLPGRAAGYDRQGRLLSPQSSEWHNLISWIMC